MRLGRTLALTLFVAFAGHAAATAATAAEDAAGDLAQAYAPLETVAVMLDTGQALLFDEGAKKYRIVSVGEEVAGWKVVAIEANKVVVVRGDARDELSLVGKNGPRQVAATPPAAAPAPPAAPAAPVEGPAAPPAAAPAKNAPPAAAPAKNAPPAPPKPAIAAEEVAPRKVARSELNRELGDFERLSAAVDVGVEASGGFRLQRVEKNSWPYKMGLRQGDIIRAVAGERMVTIDDAARVYARLRTAKSFTIEVDRPMAGIVEEPDMPMVRVTLAYTVGK